MGQSSVVETVGDAFSINTLLTQTRNHLGNIQHGTFGAGFDNLYESIACVQTLDADFTGFTGCIVQNVADLDLKLLSIRLAGIVFKDAKMDLVDNILDIFHFVHNYPQNSFGRLTVRYQITNTNTVRTGFHVFGNDLL